MVKKYDIFISYRRDGGYDTAKHLNDLLVRDGYKVSFDIDTLRSGNFDTQLYQRIDQCKDFILIVDQHAFDKTLDKNFDPKKDWLRCELAHALKQNKNIIPVFLSGISGFPDNLPEDIANVAKKNGPEYNRYHFNAFYEGLKKRFIQSIPQKTYYKTIIIILFVALLGYIASINRRTRPNNNLTKEDTITIISQEPSTNDVILNSYDESDRNVTSSTGGLTIPEQNSQPKNETEIETKETSSTLLDNRYETDLTLIEIGDYFYEDRSFSHYLYNDKKCIGVVYDRAAPYYANIIAMDNYGSGNWAVYEKVKNNGSSYSAGGLKWRIPYVGEWITILSNLANITCKEIYYDESYLGKIEFNSQKALKGLNIYNLSFNEEGWYWADGEYLSTTGQDEGWSLSFMNSCLYPGTESYPYFRYVANIED